MNTANQVQKSIPLERLCDFFDSVAFLEKKSDIYVSLR